MEILPGITFTDPPFPFINKQLRDQFVIVNKTLIQKIRNKTPAEFLCLVRDSSSNAKDGLDFYKSGIVCTLEETGGKFMVKGRDRAKLSEVICDKQKHWQVKFERLQDDPSHDEIMSVHLPMMFGCIESIIRALSDWRKQLTDQPTEGYQELKKIIEKRLASLTHKRRDRETIYSLPWYLMIDFSDFFSLDFKIEMLATDKIVDRLQSVTESLIREASIFQYANALSDPEGMVILESEANIPKDK